LKEDIIPFGADRLTHGLAPILAVFIGLSAILIVPVGDQVSIAGYDVPLVIANVGILFFLAFSSLAVYSVVLAGWASHNKFSLYGALRASAQMVSYEISMGLAVVGAVLLWGSISLVDMVHAQGIGNLKELIYFLLSIPFFIVFFICALAETNRAPFDLPECESELVAGFHTEYSGMKFASFFIAEYANIIAISAVVVTVFLGGWKGPGILGLGDLPFIWFFIKLFGMLWMFVWIRATFPRFRYDQLMDFGWKSLLPFTLAWLLVVGFVVAWWGPVTAA
jgi:NADH-quinone oxidoreductase subunit H